MENVACRVTLRHCEATEYHMEKAREFDPFGHAGLTPSGIIRLTPSGKIKMTPVDDTAGEFFCSFESPCPGTAGFNVKYYKI